jgi:hypothetical protein
MSEPVATARVTQERTMPDEHGVSATPASDPRRGALAGAAGRLAVAMGFVYYVFNWGGPFFRQNEGMSLGELLTASPAMAGTFLLSAGIGAFAGGVGGATCRPALGAGIGALLSGGGCLVLFVLPANLMIGLSGGGVTDYTEDKTAIAAALAAMTVVGTVAGGLGAAAGRGGPAGG